MTRRFASLAAPIPRVKDGERSKSLKSSSAGSVSTSFTPYRDSEDKWSTTLAQALSLGTTHLSLYQLTIEPGTRFREHGCAPRF
jgi:hypothetical protein